MGRKGCLNLNRAYYCGFPPLFSGLRQFCDMFSYFSRYHPPWEFHFLPRCSRPTYLPPRLFLDSHPCSLSPLRSWINVLLPVVHCSVWTPYPSHGLPPCSGGGSMQYRNLVFLPTPPQFFTQPLHWPHGPQLPWTAAIRDLVLEIWSCYFREALKVIFFYEDIEKGGKKRLRYYHHRQRNRRLHHHWYD